jgi:hypothetical protein
VYPGKQPSTALFSLFIVPEVAWVEPSPRRDAAGDQCVFQPMWIPVGSKYEPLGVCLG